MAKEDYTPLLPEGFQEIGRWQLDQHFLEPFANHEQRKRLIDKLQLYLTEVMAIGLMAELWIDGSFTTQKPEPEDIDVVFLFNRADIDSLTGRKAEMFEKLLINNEIIRAQYGVDAYFADKDDPTEIEKWINEYGYDRRKLNKKGIFKIMLQPNV